MNEIEIAITELYSPLRDARMSEQRKISYGTTLVISSKECFDGGEDFWL
jgi:hypothetical protein